MTDVSHPLFARFWAWAAPNAASFRDRKATVADLTGRVVEVGAGSGTNLPLYGAGAEVVAVEPEPYLRERAAEAAAGSAATVTVVGGTADALPVADGWADAAVACLVLCTVPDQVAALAELRRVLKPGGVLRFYEHVDAEGAVGRRVLRGLDHAWPHLAGGCHVTRDTVAAIRAAGFEVGEVRRFTVGAGPLGLPHVLGSAVAGP